MEKDSENSVQSSMSSTSSSGMFHFSGSFRHSSVVDRKCRTWKKKKKNTTCAVDETHGQQTFHNTIRESDELRLVNKIV